MPSPFINPRTRSGDMQKRIRLILIIGLLTGIALYLRIAYIQHTVIYRPIQADALEYVTYGRNIAHHATYSKQLGTDQPQPDAFRSPGYPLLIAAAIRVTGDESFLRIVLFIQILLSALLVPMTFFAGIPFLSRRYAILAAALVALNPHLTAMTSYLLTETLNAFLLLAAFVLYVHAYKNMSITQFLASGLFWGAAYMTNETCLLLPPTISAVTIVTCRGASAGNRKQLIAGMACSLVVFLIFPLGWNIRNRINLPPDSPRGSLRAINTLSHGSYPGFIFESEQFKYRPYKEDPQQPEFGRSLNRFTAVMAERIKQRPLRYLAWYLFEKPYYLWSWNLLQGQGDVYVYRVKHSLYTQSPVADGIRLLYRYTHPLIVLFAAVGMLLLIVRKTEWGQPPDGGLPVVLVALVIIYYTTIYSVFAPWPRYAVPLRPFLYLVFLYAAPRLTQGIRDRILSGNR